MVGLKTSLALLRSIFFMILIGSSVQFEFGGFVFLFDRFFFSLDGFTCSVADCGE